MYMQQFLNYGRQLTAEEFDLILLEDASAPSLNPPTIEQFKEQVCKFRLGHWNFQVDAYEYYHLFQNTYVILELRC